MSLEAAAKVIGANTAEAVRLPHEGFDSVEWNWKLGSFACYFGLMIASDAVIGYYGFERTSDTAFSVINERTGEWRPASKPPSRARVQPDGSIPIP